ncbi:Beta-TrCP like protein [Verticillium longisporum]|uniref:Beta-TrCP like protein n=1 Tax=Verticillium longisporum TaxID=100787 RepID=A0A8I2ZYF0_VERLO|nr:Beta-TrCP like protein [Verticillium longisporum]
MSRRVIPVAEWAPVQEAIFDEPAGEASTSSSITAVDFPPREPVAAAYNKDRLRSKSHSYSLFSRRRPQSMFGLPLSSPKSDGTELGLNIQGLAVDGSSSVPTQSRAKHGHSQSVAAGTRTRQAAGEDGSIKSIIRRASISLRGMVNHRQRHSIAYPTPADAFDQQTSDSPVASPSTIPRPGTSHSVWGRRLRQAASFRHHRTSHGAVDGEQPRFDHTFPSLPLPGTGTEPPIIPRQTGAAAKAAAAAQNESLGLGRPSTSQQPRQNKWLRAFSTGEDAGNDRESGIGITVTAADSDTELAVEDADLKEDANISRIDFVSSLPVELSIQILSYLHGSALANATVVSHHWHEVVSNQHVWRDAFLRAKTGTYATTNAVQPGCGYGVPPIQPCVDWKEVYRVREQLDRSWRDGQAKPVYLNGHSDSIYCLQFDESKIITGSRDRTIRIWDMQSLQCRLVIGPPDVVNDVSLLLDAEGQPTHHAVHPDGTRASPSMPAVTSFPLHHEASILCLQYDNEILVTGSSDSSCIVYSVQDGYRPIRRLQHHGAAVLDLAFDDRHIVTCSKDVSICVWDRHTGALLRQLRGHAGPVNAVQLRGNTIVSCSGDFRVKLWNVDTGKNIREFVGHTKGLACSQFTEDGRFVASAGNDKIIRIWDANTGECVREIKAHDNLVRSLHIDSVSGRLISGSYDQDIKVFDMATGRQLLDFPKWHASWVLSAKSDYRRIVSTGQDPKILIMDFGANVQGIEMLNSARAVEVEGEYI